jgi:hypothetical protein
MAFEGSVNLFISLFLVVIFLIILLFILDKFLLLDLPLAYSLEWNITDIKLNPITSSSF